MWWSIAQLVVSVIVSLFLAPKGPPPPAAAKKEDAGIPRGEEGAELPLIGGTVLIRDPQIGWSDGFNTIPVRKKGGKK